jgi:Leucine-rich repeat (LRR) protein
MKKALTVFLAVFAIVVGGCKDYQNDIDALDKRVTALETWQKSVNADITSIKTVVNALEEKDYVTGVSALTDGTGYTITFQNSGTITIHNGEDGAQGEKGDTPKISTKQDTDGKYYWTLDGEWLLSDGVKIPTSGNDGITPVVRINETSGEWEISTDGGTTYTSTGVKAQGTDGDSFFKSVDNTNAGYVTFTLQDGTTLQVAKYKAFKIGVDSDNDAWLVDEGTSIIPLSLPGGLDFKESDYTMITAEVKTPQGTSMDLQGRAATTPWSVKIIKPTLKNNGLFSYYYAAVQVTTPTGIEEGDYAYLEVTLVGNDGSKLTAARGLQVAGPFADKAFRKYIITNVTGLTAEDGVTALTTDSKTIPLTVVNIKTLAAFTGGIKLYFENISSVRGIEYMTGITKLNLNGNEITSLDVSNNTKLTDLDCSFNKITSLDVSNNTKLTDLNCSYNKLTSLNVSKNTLLGELSCETNKITSLDVSHNTQLTFLNCVNNRLTSLDVSKNAQLAKLYCGKNELTNLDVSHNTQLTLLYCANNELTNLDVSHNTQLTTLYCDNNELTNLDMSHNTQLTTFYCGNNRLTNLDVSHNAQLTLLECGNNRLTSLDMLHNTQLTNLYCNKNRLTSLDVSKNTQMAVLDCYINQLSSLDISALTKIKQWQVGKQTDATGKNMTIKLTLKEAQKSARVNDDDNFNENVEYVVVE